MRSVTACCVVCAALLAAAMASCSPPVPADADSPPAVEAAATDSVRDQVTAVIEQYYSDLSARDWSRFADHFWPDAIMATKWHPPGEPGERVVTTTVPSFIEQAPLGPGSRQIFEESMTGAHVRAEGDLAHVWANYHARFGDPGDIQEWDGIDAFTLIRFDGRWRIVAIAYLATDSVSG